MARIWRPIRMMCVAIALMLASTSALAQSDETPEQRGESWTVTLPEIAAAARSETVPGQQGDVPKETIDSTDFESHLSQVEEVHEGTTNSADGETTEDKHEESPEGDSNSVQSEVVPGQHNEVPEGTTADAFRIIAEKYAADVGVSVEEAMRRLELQGIVGELRAELNEHASDVLGGIRIEHKPDFRVIVSVIPGGDARVQALIDNSPLSNLATIETVELTETELENEQLRLNDQLNQLGIRFSSGIFGQEIRIFVDDENEFMQRVWEAGIRLPDFVIVDDTTGVGEFLGGTPGGSNSSEPPTNGTAGP